MGFKVLTCEKPSVAGALADVIGANDRKRGYFEGNGYRVTWAVGHLVGLEEPDAYGFMKQKDIYNNAEKAWNELPIIPSEFKLKILEPTEEQFKIVKQLMLSDETDEIIDCGDMGPEGHILQWFIREKAGCKKTVRRFCATSMTKEAILYAMNHLRPIEDFENIIKGEYCKKKADWMIGMSLSRAGSLRYNTNFSVGRVQSPTLYFVVKRYIDVTNFKQSTFHTMKADFDSFSVFWNKDNDGIFNSDVKDSENRITQKSVLDNKCQDIKNAGYGYITELNREKRGTNRPQLYDITELERDANRRYGYTAAETLATAQALYETQKVLSYPRTDSRYITSDLVPYMAERIKYISTISKYSDSCKKISTEGLNIDKRIADDSKVTDHHALICTEYIKDFDIEAMKPTSEEQRKGVSSEKMKNVLNLVLTRMIVAFSQPYYYEQTTVEVTFLDKIHFAASGKRTISEGWKEAEKKLIGNNEQDEDEYREEQTFPCLEKGMRVNLKDCSVISKKTTPPKLHTEATLLTAMENAGASIEGGEILKGRGIGTQATRAEIIKVLFDKGYCTTTKKGKTNYIVPTQKGLKIVRALPVELTSPKLTADWENKIALIADGKATEEDFMKDFIPFVRAKTEEIRQSTLKIDFRNNKEPVGKCPFCGADVYKGKSKKDGKSLFYCSDYFADENPCDFLWYMDDAYITSIIRKSLTEKDTIKFINDKTLTKKGYKQGSNKTHQVKFHFERDLDGNRRKAKAVLEKKNKNKKKKYSFYS